MTRNLNSPKPLPPASPILHPRSAFTLVELLVVITIIGILAALITTAAVGAMGKAQETRIKAEINQIDAALTEYKNKTTAYPPNCQTDDTGLPIVESTVLNDLKRHLKQAFPRHQEPPELIAALAGLTAATPPAQLPPAQGLQGGITAGEAIVFWLGGFSSDPKYPISGEGGPSYRIQSMGNTVNATLDPIESRKWVFPFEITRLVPRTDDGYFDEEDGRFIEYTVTINNQQQFRRINFWQYAPRGQVQPYLYFDTSRHAPTGEFDPPAATEPSGLELHVHAFKKPSESASAAVPFQFVNPDKFQILHCGRDDDWDESQFDRMSAYEGNTPDLLFPDGPFIGEVADTIVNFAEQTRIEDAQP
jgi:prepilin-type N-terminal cleavage/methylation domain-containing protein